MTRLFEHAFLRFALVGAAVALLYVLGYLGLLALGFAQIVANGAAFLFAVIVQYFGQTIFTFRQPVKQPKQVLRFVCTIGLGLVVSALITGRLGPALGWSDWSGALLVTVVLPVQNYIIFKIWVYRPTNAQSE